MQAPSLNDAIQIKLQIIYVIVVQQFYVEILLHFFYFSYMTVQKI